MKKSGSVLCSFLWLIVAIVYAASGKSWAALTSFIGSVVFFILFLYYKRKER